MTLYYISNNLEIFHIVVHSFYKTFKMYIRFNIFLKMNGYFSNKPNLMCTKMYLVIF